MSGFLWVIAVASLGVFFAYLSEKARRRAVLREIRKRCGSRVRAADRLRHIIAADRAAVSCGLWVKMRQFSWAEKMELWSMQNGAMVFEAYVPAPFPPRPPEKLRYRWSERR